MRDSTFSCLNYVRILILFIRLWAVAEGMNSYADEEAQSPEPKKDS